MAQGLSGHGCEQPGHVKGTGFSPYITYSPNESGLQPLRECSYPASTTNETPFNAGPVFSALLKQLYIDQQYVPRTILVPGRLRRSRDAGRAAHRAHRPSHRDRRAAARRQEIARRSCRPERARSPTRSASACSSPRARPFRKRWPTRSCCPSCRAASSASTSRTSRARRRWPRWWCGKTAR